MSLWWIAALLAYVWAVRATFRWLIEDDALHGRQTIKNWWDFWSLAGMAGILFWLILLIRLHNRLKAKPRRFDPEKAARVVGGESRKARLKRVERERDEARRRTEKLEHELGIT